MKKVLIVNVINDEELCDLKFLLFARNFTNIGAYYVNKPVLINFSDKTFNSIENNDLCLLKSKINIIELSLKEFKENLSNKNNEIEK